MSDDTRKPELLREMARLFIEVQPGSEFAPCKDMQEWERLVESPEQQELLRELARFADLWRNVGGVQAEAGPRDRKRDWRSTYTSSASVLRNSSNINRELMRRICDAGESPQFRQ